MGIRPSQPRKATAVAKIKFLLFGAMIKTFFITVKPYAAANFFMLCDFCDLLFVAGRSPIRNSPPKQTTSSVIVICKDQVQHDQQQNQPRAAASALITGILTRPRAGQSCGGGQQHFCLKLPPASASQPPCTAWALRPAIIPLFPHKASIGCQDFKSILHPMQVFCIFVLRSPVKLLASSSAAASSATSAASASASSAAARSPSDTMYSSSG